MYGAVSNGDDVKHMGSTETAIVYAAMKWFGKEAARREISKTGRNL